MSNLTCKIYTLGCKVNQYDSGRLGKVLADNSIKAVSQKATVAIINTCAVTKSALTKDRQAVNRARQENPQAKIIVLGCWPKTDQTKIAGVDLWWAKRDWLELTSEIIKLWGKSHSQCQLRETVTFADFAGTQKPSARQPKTLPKNCAGQLVHSDRARYFIKIQDGCRQFCAYCIIPFARGPLASREPVEVLAEIKAALTAGYQEIILSGIHLGLYGVDLKTKINLVGLLKKILALPNLGRVRLSSIEITEVNDELIKLMQASPKICAHLHISLQAGADKILQSMNRPYTTKYFAARVAKLRRAVPAVAITTDIIVGFPGETDQDFLETYNFARQINFSKIHVFSFSAHAGTKAFTLPNKVRPEIIKIRSAQLRQLSKELEINYQAAILKKYRNKFLPVVIEAAQGDKIKGKTEFYFDIYFSPNKLKRPAAEAIGQIVKIKMEK